MIRLMNQSTPETQKQLKVGEFSFTPKSIRWNETNRRIVNNLNDRLKGIKKDGVIWKRQKYRFLVQSASKRAVNDIRMRDALGVERRFWKWATNYEDDG